MKEITGPDHQIVFRTYTKITIWTRIIKTEFLTFDFAFGSVGLEKYDVMWKFYRRLRQTL